MNLPALERSFAIPGARARATRVGLSAGSAWLSPRRFAFPHTDPILTECRDLIEKRQYPDAELKIHTYLRAHPDSAEAHFLLGYALYRENKPRESLAEYTSGAQLHKPGANDLAVVAMDNILLRDYADADKWLTPNPAPPNERQPN